MFSSEIVENFSQFFKDFSTCPFPFYTWKLTIPKNNLYSHLVKWLQVLGAQMENTFKKDGP